MEDDGPLGRLVVVRSPRLFGLLRRYEVLCDGARIGSLRRGGSIEVRLPVGTHLLRARLDWTSSHPLHVRVAEDGVTTVRVSDSETRTFWSTFSTRPGYLEIEED